MKKRPRRTFLRLVAGAAALPIFSREARTQNYPRRPVRLVVGFGAGGAGDILARLLGQWLSERLGQTFVVEDRPGAGSNLATEAVANAPPDGYTLLIISTPQAINATLYERLNLNFLRDIAPVASVWRGIPAVMEVNPSFPAKTVAEFIAYAKSNPGRINMASAGIGSINHVYGELFKLMAGVDMLHVPYRGTAPALTDLVGGQVHVIFDSVVSSIAFIRSGKLRPLAVTSRSRLAALPDVPAAAEFVPGYEATGWMGVGAPRNTPAEVIGKLNREINAGLANANIKARIAELGYPPVPSSPAEFGALIAADVEKWAKVIRSANLRAE
jgi:tripartite-type tricarboxylate transporter receptor subunit TctC